MLVLNRSEYCTVRNDYSMDFGQDELDELQKYVNEKWVSKDGDSAPQLTFEDVAHCFNREDDELAPVFTESRKFHWWRNDSEYFLNDLIYDYLNDMVWECYCDCDTVDTDSIEDEAIFTE